MFIANLCPLFLSYCSEMSNYKITSAVVKCILSQFLKILHLKVFPVIKYNIFTFTC